MSFLCEIDISTVYKLQSQFGFICAPPHASGWVWRLYLWAELRGEQILYSSGDLAKSP